MLTKELIYDEHQFYLYRIIIIIDQSTLMHWHHYAVIYIIMNVYALNKIAIRFFA